MFRFNKPSSGSLLSCSAKVIILKILRIITLAKRNKILSIITLAEHNNELPDDGLLNRYVLGAF
jgi:hypothetical protein